MSRLVQIGRHVREPDAADLGAAVLARAHGRDGRDQARRGLPSDGGGGHLGRVQAFLDEAGRERDDTVAAHRAVALVVHEQHGDVGVRAERRQEHGAVHVAMPPRLVHEHLTGAVGVLPGPASPVQDGRERHLGIARADQADGFTAGMEVDGLEGRPGVRPRGADSRGGRPIGRLSGPRSPRAVSPGPSSRTAGSPGVRRQHRRPRPRWSRRPGCPPAFRRSRGPPRAHGARRPPTARAGRRPVAIDARPAPSPQRGRCARPHGRRPRPPADRYRCRFG